MARPVALHPRPLLAAAFLALVLPLGVVLAVITPPGQVADEVGHIERATALSEGHVLGVRGYTVDADGVWRRAAGVYGEPGPALAAFGPLPEGRALSAEEIVATRRRGWFGRDSFLQISPLAVYLPLFYVPSAAGIAVARSLGADPTRTLLAGRLVGLVVYAALGLTALLVTRRGRALLFCALALPMSLSLGASFNQDGLLFAASALAAALASRGPEEQRARLGAAVLICVVATVKLPYLVLAALLLPPLGGGGGRGHPWSALRARLRLTALVSLPALGWTAYAMVAISVPVPWPAYAAGPLWPGPAGQVFDALDAAAQLRVLVADPALVLTLPLRTIAASPWLARQTVGVLGWLSIPLPGWLYAAWAVAVGCALGADGIGLGRRPLAGQVADGAFLAVAALAGVILIYVSQYLVWTPVGADLIAGPQGRYLLPLLPMLAVAVPKVTRGPDGLRAALCAPAVAVALAGLAAIPPLIVASFYLR
jgi:hypothetical protein